jgi:hypothetical protein
MKKPSLKRYDDVKAYDVHDVMNFIDAKYGSNCYDVFESGKHFDLWCFKQGHGEKDPAGKPRSESKIWYAEYENHPEGSAKRPQFKAVLDWLDRVYDIYTHKATTFTFRKVDFPVRHSPEYITEFVDRVIAEFGDNVEMGHDFDDR